MVQMRSPVSLLANGKRVNWNQVTHVRAQKSIDGDGYELKIYWRYKAAIREEIFKHMASNDGQLNEYFKGFGFAPLNQGLFINLQKIMMVDEEQKYGPVEKTRIHIIFSDGMQIKETLESVQWSWFKKSFFPAN